MSKRHQKRVAERTDDSLQILLLPFMLIVWAVEWVYRKFTPPPNPLPVNGEGEPESSDEKNQKTGGE
jgi:hypothetical protein